MKPTVARIEAHIVRSNNERMCSLGTGVFINGGNFILTCHHVVQLHKHDATVCSTRGIFFARYDDFMEMEVAGCSLYHENQPHDLAILAIHNSPGNLAPTSYADFATEDVFVGQDVHVISNVVRLNYTCDSGIISNPSTTVGSFELDSVVDKDLLTYNKDLEIMDIIGITPGSGVSGAPVFNSRGGVVGIVIAMYRDHCWAIPLKVLREYISATIRD